MKTWGQSEGTKLLSSLNVTSALAAKTDLWGERRVVLRSESTNAWPEHAFLHSPVVWQDHGAWWLLAGPVGNMNLSRFHHRGLWRSEDPFQWATAVKERTPYNGLFLEGGAKVLRDEKGREWITHSGPWAGGVWLAPLYWRENKK